MNDDEIVFTGNVTRKNIKTLVETTCREHLKYICIAIFLSALLGIVFGMLLMKGY
jgi:ABC-type proline/glycine betaine transport system permease subunit